jgi:ankyrin repeat protein
LHWACRYGDLDIVKQLLHFGATPFTPDSKGFFPIDFAGFFNHSDVLKTLIDFSITKFDDLKSQNYQVEKMQMKEIKKPPKNCQSFYKFRHVFLLSPLYATKLLFWATRET